MALFDVAELLEPISPEQPCGEDLEYDLEFAALEQAAQPVAEQQFGETVVEGQEPDWKEVCRKALGLFTRTKDFRVAVLLARGAIRSDGLGGFADVIAVVRGLVERYWQDSHPQLDPDDDNDPTIRVNTLTALCDQDACLQAVQEAPLVASTMLGKFSYRDYLVASGELTPRHDEQAVEMSAIEAAFLDAELDDVQELARLVDRAVEDTEALETRLTEEVGVGNAASFSPLAELLRKTSSVLQQQLQRRGVGGAEDESFEGLDSDSAEGATTARVAPDEVRTREDVVRLLDKICEYYLRNEPSSPVPLMLQRAKRVVTMDFMELLRDIAPTGVEEAETVVGAPDEGEEEPYE